MQLGQLCKFVIRLGAAAQQSTHRVAVLMVMTAMLGANTPAAQESSTVLSSQALLEIAQVEAEIDRVEAQTMEWLAAPPDNQVQQIELIGKLLL
jgi:cytochrome c peroxidase